MADVGIKIRATDEASGVFNKVAAEAGKLQTSVASVGTSFAALGSAAVAGVSVISFATKIKDAIDVADAFNKLSQKTGVAVESLSKLNYAAGLADVSTEALATGMRKLNISIAQAAGGNEAKIALFKALGVSIKDSSGHALAADKVFASLSDVMSKSGDGAEKIAVGSELMGKGFVDLVPLANAGAKGLKDMGDEATKLGIVMSADFAKNAEEFNDNLHKMSLAGQGLMVTLGGDLVRLLGEASSEMAKAAIEGGKLAGVWAGLKSIFNGPKQYQNDRALVEQADILWNLEKALVQQKAEGYAIDSKVVQSTMKQIENVKSQLAVTQQQRKELAGLAKDKEESDAETQRLLRGGPSKALRDANALLGNGGNAPKPPKEKGNAFSGEQEAAKEWAKALEAAGKASDELVAKNLDLSKSESALKVYMESAAAVLNEKTNPAMNAMVKAAYEANIALEAMGKLADVIEAQQRRTSTAEDETQKERERVAAIGLTTQAVAELNATRLEEMATAKERSLMAADEIDLTGNLTDAIKGEVKALRERAALLRTGAEKESAVEAAKAASEEWKRGWEQTDQIAREAFSAWAEDGSTAAEKIGNTLKKALLSAIYEATLKPIAFQLYTSIAGGGGIGNTALQAAGGTSGSLNLLGSAGTLFGSGFKAGLGAVFGEAGTMGGLSAGWTALGAGNIAGGLGTLAGAALPWIGGVMALKGLTDYQITPTGNALTATLSSSGIPSGQVGTRADFTQSSSGILSGGTTQNSTWGVADAATTKYIGDNVVAGTAAVKSWATAIGLSASAVDGFTQSIEVSLTGLNPEQAKAAIDKALGRFTDDMVTSAFGGTLTAFAKEGETSSQTLQRLAVDLTTVNSIFDTLGYSLLDVSTAGASAAEGLLAAFGGLQNFQAQTAAMYSNFYTTEEQKGATVKSIVSELTALGINTSEADIAGADRSTWRMVLDAFAKDTGTEAGAKKYAAVVAAANRLNPYLDAPGGKAAASMPQSASPSTAASAPVIEDAALSAWQDATDAIVSTMTDLRSTLIGDGVDSFSKLQAQFAIETAQAKAGDLAAAQDLPALAKSLADASKAQYATSVERDLFIARIIDSLGSVVGASGAGASLSIPHFASGGYHDGGWALVGEQGPELVNMPRARVFNANDTRSMLGGGTDPAVLEELRALRTEVAALRAISQATSSAARATARVLESSANGGQPLTTKAVT